MKKQHSILLVEDEENFGSVLKNYLELSNYIVTLCTDGNQGLYSFKNNIYDLCIVDVMMPKRDGFSLATEIKKNDPNIPLIFLTAKKLKEDILKGYQIGADDYITKPFDTEILLYKLEAILSRNGLQNNQKETANLRQKQKQARQELVFRHGDVRAVLQDEFKQVRGKQRDERTLLAKRIHEYRSMQDRERNHDNNRTARPAFDRATQGKSQGRSKSSERTRIRSSKRSTRTRERKPE